MLFQNILCTFLGHKADKTVLAYNIKSHDTTYDVKVYEVAKCSRCNKISDANPQILESVQSRINTIMNNG